jgi:cytidylate kinase
VLADIRQRDYQDSHRAVAPLKQADDAILVDTSSIGLQESFGLLKRTILAHI